MSAKGTKRSDDEKTDGVPWYREAFGEFYADLYAHRSLREAKGLVAAIKRIRPLEGPVLDVACGGGRLLQALTTPGRQVIGVDLSLPLLRRAQSLGPDFKLAQADMRALPVGAESVSAVFFLFTSFGYFDDRAEDEEVLGGAARALRPGGWLVLDFLNPAPTLAGLVPESERVVHGFRVRERRRYAPESRQIKKNVEVWDEVGIQLEYEECVRVYEHSEFVELFARAGLVVAETWGDYEGRAYDAERSPRMIFHAEKRSPR